jgi:phosphatidylinositol alpha 1,6-mannosyltransferase
MRIAYFNATLQAGQDGVTRVVYKMMEGALARRHEVMAFSALVPKPVQQIVPMVKVPSFALPLQRAYRIPLPNYQTFARTLNTFQPDVLHINSPCPLACAATRYGAEFHVPVVATYHTHFPAYLRYYGLEGNEQLVWGVLKCLYRKVDRVFVPSMPILQELRRQGIERMEHIPNGIDLKLFDPRHRSAEWRRRISPSGKPVLLSVSRLVWEKDLRILAKAYNAIRSRRRDLEMVVVGDGHARAELEHLMLGAHFLGFQTGERLSESYASGDIFVLASTTESFGLVTLEAMSSGLVPVAARVGGALEIIEEGRSGFLANPFDADDLAERIETLLDNPTQRRIMARNARLRAEQYGWDKILDKLFLAYEEVIDEHQRKSSVTQFDERLIS